MQIMWNKVVSLRNVAGWQRLKVVSNHLRMLSNDGAVSNEDVIMETKQNVGLITLNRPKMLNTLNLEMIRKIHPELKKWETDPSISLIIIKGVGEKAFCAGGDVRAVAEAGLSGDSLTKDFFREEYELNNAIGTLKTPYVAIIDGVTMGGGVGLSVHGHCRVGTDRTVFAMPETAIGLFPDVGGSFFLPKLQGQLGTFLALTGEKLRSYDVYNAGVATHFVSCDKIPELEKSLTRLEKPSLNGILQTLESYQKDSVSTVDKEFSLGPHLDTINRCFDKDTVEEIVTALEQEGTEWAKSKVDVINKMSPISLKVSLKQLREGAKLRTLFECLTMEYRLVQRFMEDKDFYEGVRAVLIDRDNSPKWTPSTLQAVTAEKVDSYFASLGENELEF